MVHSERATFAVIFRFF